MCNKVYFVFLHYNFLFVKTNQVVRMIYGGS